MAKYEYLENGKVRLENGEVGSYRVIRGRKVFIREGEDLYSAMEKSGKFKEFGRRGTKQISDSYEKQDMVKSYPTTTAEKMKWYKERRKKFSSEDDAFKKDLINIKEREFRKQDEELYLPKHSTIEKQRVLKKQHYDYGNHPEKDKINEYSLEYGAKSGKWDDPAQNDLDRANKRIAEFKRRKMSIEKPVDSIDENGKVNYTRDVEEYYASFPVEGVISDLNHRKHLMEIGWYALQEEDFYQQWNETTQKYIEKRKAENNVGKVKVGDYQYNTEKEAKHRMRKLQNELDHHGYINQKEYDDMNKELDTLRNKYDKRLTDLQRNALYEIASDKKIMAEDLSNERASTERDLDIRKELTGMDEKEFKKEERIANKIHNEYSMKETEAERNSKLMTSEEYKNGRYDFDNDDNEIGFVQEDSMYGGVIKEYTNKELREMAERGIRPRKDSYGHPGAWEGINSDKGLSNKEIAKAVQDAMKKKYPNTKLTRSTAGYDNVEITIASSSEPIVVSNNDIDKMGFSDFGRLSSSNGFHWWAKENVPGYKERPAYSIEDVRKYAKTLLKEQYKGTRLSQDDWYLTEYGKNLVKDIQRELNSYNYDDSNGMVDYFNSGFSDDITLGKWNKPFESVDKKIEAKVERFKNRKKR